MRYFAPFRLDPSGTLWKEHAPVPLTRKACRLLEHMVDRAGHLITREELLAAVWPESHVHPDNVKVLIAEVRRALGDNPAQPQYIRTAAGRGYVFISPVADAPEGMAAAGRGTLVGRERPLDILLNALDGAAQDRRQMIVVTGEAGIGKTMLSEEFLRRAAKDRTLCVRSGSCLTARVLAQPYSPLVQALSRPSDEATESVIISTLERHIPSWVPRFGWQARWPADAWARSTRARSVPNLLQVITALEALAVDVPFVLWLDDVQWADPDTIDVLAGLGRRRDPAKLMILLTLPSIDRVPGHAGFSRAFSDLVTLGRAQEVHLSPLTVEEVERYLDVRFGSREISAAAGRLHQATGGSPLFLALATDELARFGFLVSDRDGWKLAGGAAAIDAAIPRSLAGAVAQQMSALPPDERRALEAAAIVGPEFTLWAAAHAADVDEISLEPVLERLARRRAFVVHEGLTGLPGQILTSRYSFLHTLFQEMALQSWTASDRPAAHGRLAIALESAYRGREREIGVQLAYHFHGAGDHAKAAQYLRLAAQNSSERQATQETTALLSGALAHASRLPSEGNGLEVSLLLELGEAEIAAGERTSAAATLQRAARRARNTGRTADEIRALLAMAELHLHESSSDAALEHAQRASELAGDLPDQGFAAAAILRAGIVRLQLEGWSDEVAQRCTDAGRILRNAPEHLRRAGAIQLTFIHQMQSDYAAAWRSARRHLPVIRERGNLVSTLECCRALAVAALHVGQWGDAARAVEEGEAAAARARNAFEAISMRLHQAWIDLEGLRWEDARKHALSDRAVIENAGWTIALQLSLLLNGSAALFLGRLEEAAEELKRLREWQSRDRLPMNWLWKIPLHISLAELGRRMGDLTIAAAEARHAREAAEATGERMWRSRASIVDAEVAIDAGRFDQAEHTLRLARHEIRGTRAPLAAWRIDMSLASLLARTNRADAARRVRSRGERMLQQMQRTLTVRPAF
jgi:DNA-binding winged helix-turn-helix (wHTH) protein/tetratricopeptide (TPR) repeat protein